MHAELLAYCEGITAHWYTKPLGREAPLSKTDPEPQFAPLLPEHSGSASAWKRASLAIAGCALVGLGVVGWILPFAPGIPVLILGLVLLGGTHSRVASMINTAEQRLPSSVRKLLRPKSSSRSPKESPEQRNVRRLFDP